MSNTGRFDSLVENKEEKNIFKQSPKKEGRFKDESNNDYGDNTRNTFKQRNSDFKQRRPDFKKVYRGRGDYNSFSRKIVSEKKEKPKNFEMKEEDFPSL